MAPSRCARSTAVRALESRRQQDADEDIGVEDTAQLRALQKRIQNLRSKPARLCLAPCFVQHLFQ
jgi:hypothetical protein